LIFSKENGKIKIQDNEIDIKKSDSIKLIKNNKYKVNLLHFDYEYKEPYFYVSLFENIEKIEKLDTKLQEPINEEKDSYVKYVSKLSEIKLNDKLEALYDMDNKWYRVNVTDISKEAVTIYFLDFGNSLTLNEAELNKILRFRNYYKNKEEKEIFDLEYQAVQCVYSLNLNSTLEEFINKLAELNIDEGFDVKIKDITKDQKGYLLYNVILLSDDTSAEADFILSKIFY
jgi:hypothetical protein